MTRYSYSVEQDYFHWLCEMVHIDHGNGSWWLVAKDLHRHKFVPYLDRDENRALDGLSLREQFLESEWFTTRNLLDGDCSVLEMLIALAQRMDFETSDVYEGCEDKTAYWFWEMLDNLGLTAFDDESYVELEGQTYVDQIIDKFVDREYRYDGEGGIFPLNHSNRDQRNVELWYQMSAYLCEHEEAMA